MSELVLVIVSGLTIGIFGSFHCIGMCGPLALALPVNKLNPVNKSVAVILYNLGRALSYSTLGILIGIIGQGFSFFDLQQSLSITAGVLILTILLLNEFGRFKNNLISKYSQGIKWKLGNYLKSEKKLSTYLYVGVLNGLLPCGLVYIAITAALATGAILKSSILMFSFGLGTLPMMALTMFLGKFISFKFRTRLNSITPYFIMFIAVLLIVRGLNLGIPYLSPVHNAHQMPMCR